MALHYPDFDWISGALPSECYVGSTHVQRSIFNNPRSCVSAANSTAILLTVWPHCSNLSLQDALVYLRLNDLIPALGNYFADHTYTACHSHCISSPSCLLLFQAIHSWEKLRIQQHSTRDVQVVMPTQTVQAKPPNDKLPFGCGNTVLVEHKSGDLLSFELGSGCM